MNKHYYYGQLKSTGTTYLLWFIGFHFAYLGHWGLLILYWLTGGGFFVWIFIELFMIPDRVSTINGRIYAQIDAIEKQEKEEDHRRHMTSLRAITQERPIVKDEVSMSKEEIARKAKLYDQKNPRK